MKVTLHDPLPPDHWIDRSFSIDTTTHTYRARCSCGWVGTELSSSEGTDRALADHQNASKEIAS